MRRPHVLTAAGAALLVASVGVFTSAMARAAVAGCSVTYSVASQWPSGFTGNVSVRNLGDALNGWTLTWSFSAGQAVQQAWNADVTQSGAAVTARNAAWNAGLPTNGTATFGFNGSWNNSANPVPTAFALNGVACTGGTTVTTGATTTRPATTTSRPTSAAPTSTRPSSAAPTSRPPVTTVGPTATSVTTPPPEKTVRVFWLRPSDVPYDPRWPDGIANVMREAQRYYKQELGKTFTLNTVVVETVVGDHVRSWYENTPNGGDKYWYSVFNMAEELKRKYGLRDGDPRWLIVGEISAEGDGAGGGGGNGWVILCQHDADGAAGVRSEPMNRWYGGMVHELGHALGLPDSTSTDGTPMSASFYSYPNTHFSAAQKAAILNGPYGSFLS